MAEWFLEWGSKMPTWFWVTQFFMWTTFILVNLYLFAPTIEEEK